MYLPKLTPRSVDPPMELDTRTVLEVLRTLFANVQPESIYYEDDPLCDVTIGGAMRVVAGVKNPANVVTIDLDRLERDLLDPDAFAAEVALVRKYEKIGRALVTEELRKKRQQRIKQREAAP